ncbi:MAG: hypothetical protein AAGN46_16640 [Acidobacteriota bacterium]
MTTASPLLLAATALVAYHLAQKSVPADAAPVAVIAVAYLAGLATCLVAAPFLLEGATIPEAFASIGRAWPICAAIGVAAAGIEFGFLLAYRAGWPVSTASLLVNVAVALVLLAVGLVVYREAVTSGVLVGVALCLSGLWLILK